MLVRQDCMIISEADDEILLLCKCSLTSGKGVGTSDCAMAEQHWDPEEGTVCRDSSAVQVVVVSASLRGVQACCLILLYHTLAHT